ncbi:hypothetical protein [Ferruginibacter sp.]
MSRYLFLLLLLFSTRWVTAQTSVRQIDSICTSIDQKNDLNCYQACGRNVSHLTCYNNYNEDSLLHSDGFIDRNDSSFAFSYYYFNNQPVRVTLQLKHPLNNSVYNATYYFNNDTLIIVTGENVQLSNPSLALYYGRKCTYWFPLQKNNHYQ